MKTVVLAVLIASASLQSAGHDVPAAIAEGAKLKQQMHKIGFTKRGLVGGYDLLVYGPMGRVSLLSAEAAAAFKTLTPDQIDPKVLSRTLTVKAEPVAPSGGTVTRPMRALVIRAKGTENVLQPLSLERSARGWTNALGGKFDGEAVEATFDLDALPAGEIEILTVGTLGTDTVTIKDKDRVKIR